MSATVGYLRLSRDEERERGVPLAEKIELRRQILITVAKHNGFDLAPEDVTVELKSGGSLAERCGLLGILDRCRSREISTLVAFDVDRLTRDVADLKTISSALFRGECTLVTQRGVYRFDRHFDTTLLQILAVLGEKERRSFSYRRKATNEQRARNGQLSQGRAPYGYRWNADAKCFSVHLEEYPIVEEIFRRSWSEGTHRIAADLNRRGVEPPGSVRIITACNRWLRGTVANMLRNPFYTGRLAKRKEVDREGEAQLLPRARWIWSGELQTVGEDEKPRALPHPISLDDWERLAELRSGRAQGEPKAGLLSTILRCPAGRPMRAHNDTYHCDCAREGDHHAGTHVSRSMLESAVWRVMREIMQPVCDAPPPKARVRSAEARAEQWDAERRQALRDLREKESTLQELVMRASYYRSLPHYGVSDRSGKSQYDRSLEALGADCEHLQSRADELAERIEADQTRRSGLLLQEYARAGGLLETMEFAGDEVRRGLVLLAIKRIDIPAPPGPRKMCRHACVTLHPIGAPGDAPRIIELIHPRTGKPRGPYKQDSASRTD